MEKPIIIEMLEDSEPQIRIDDILKPKVAQAKKLSDEQLKMMRAYKLFQEKYLAQH